MTLIQSLLHDTKIPLRFTDPQFPSHVISSTEGLLYCILGSYPSDLHYVKSTPFLLCVSFGSRQQKTLRLYFFLLLSFFGFLVFPYTVRYLKTSLLRFPPKPFPFYSYNLYRKYPYSDRCYMSCLVYCSQTFPPFRPGLDLIPVIIFFLPYNCYDCFAWDILHLSLIICLHRFLYFFSYC